MTLQKTLQQIKAASRAKMPVETAAIVTRAADRLAESGIIEMALKTGDRAPEFDLTDAHGARFVMSEVLTRGPLILNFYRGPW